MQDLSNTTLSQIVTDHYETARVFEKYRLDFCCNGERSLTSACDEFQIPVYNVLDDLQKVLSNKESESDFNKMSLAELTSYIVRVHHGYVRLNAPLISNYLFKAASEHGDRLPFIKEVYFLFLELRAALDAHMEKEEKQVFPRIVLLEMNAFKNSATTILNEATEELQHEHDQAGRNINEIRMLTNNYQAPEQVSTTFRLSLECLSAFEENLHIHVHLENNILFPKAIALFNAQLKD
jgi:regulator of cell morphogenesis and NO signaling